jgi:ABC-2 type transport system ATP-binding protein
MYGGKLMVCDTPSAIKRMLPGKVLALRADDLLLAEKLLKTWDGALDVQPYGDVLNIIVKEEMQDTDIEARLTAEGIHITSLRPTPPRLEEAFIYFVRQYASSPASTKEVSS